jgi:hypothetical protein
MTVGRFHPIDALAINRILAAVGVASALDRIGLRYAIEEAQAVQRLIIKFHRASSKDVGKEFDRIRNAADALLSLLTANNDAADWTGVIAPKAASDIRRLSVRVDAIKQILWVVPAGEDERRFAVLDCRHSLPRQS